MRFTPGAVLPALLGLALLGLETARILSLISDLARMLLVAADKWEAYLASDRGKQWDDSETGGES